MIAFEKLPDDVFDGPYTAETYPLDENGLDQAVSLLVSQAHGVSTACGWWTDLVTGQPKPVDVPQKLMLCVSELAEAMEGNRRDLMDDKLSHRKMIEVELADCLIRIADLAGALGLDLGGAVVEKILFNLNRADHKPEARGAVGGKAY